MRVSSQPPPRLCVLRRSIRLCRPVVWLAAGLLSLPLPAQVRTMPPPPPGRVESGVPAFAILGPEGLGLTTSPTEIRRLPDGRILVVSQRQLVIGDGTRWQTYHLAPEIAGSGVRSVLVDRDGSLYAGSGDGFAAIDFGEDSHWRPRPLVAIPSTASAQAPVPETACEIDGQWYWHSSSGAVVAWRPGQAPGVIGSTNAAETIFGCAGRVYVSDRADGTLLRLDSDRLVAASDPALITPRHAITAAATLDTSHALVGTHALGVLKFDGRSLTPFSTNGLLAGAGRINDLCSIPGGFFAAAVDKIGIVFFDRHGRIIQVLSQSVDHRVARTQRFLAGEDGVLWALLSDGLARIEFPSRISNLEPLIASGVNIAMPFRHEGDLWLLADGRIQRGHYDTYGRLERFIDETPPDDFAFAFSFAGPRLLIGTNRGFLLRTAGGWQTAVPGIVNGRVVSDAFHGGRWLYCARGEIGWLRPAAEGFVAERIPAPGLGDNYGALTDRDGIVWLELGTGLVGRVDPHHERPAIELFGAEAGLPNSWAQVFVINGVARFNVGNRIWRFDAAARRFSADDDFARRYGVALVDGRPARDNEGRVWISADASVRVFDDDGPVARNLGTRILPGIRPYYFTFEDSGIVWLHENHRLVRYDPAMPEIAPPPPRALITSVVLSTTNRRIFPRDGRLPPLAFEDNSLAVHFLAPANPFTQPVTFEVMLEGADQGWVSTGNVGSAVFSRLKEGRYTLRVRPLVGETAGTEARLALAIRPPWHRTTAAYVLYGLALVGAVAALAWLAAWLERREKHRLERLVVRRTAELSRQMDETRAQAAALQASEERYRRLSAELEARVDRRTAELHHANERLVASNEELEAFTYSASHDLRAPLRNIAGFADLLARRAAGRLDAEGGRYLANVSAEAVRLGHLIDSLLAFSRLQRAELQRSPCDLAQLAAAVRDELAPGLGDRAVEWRIGPLPVVVGDATLLRQVLANLVGNALKFSRDRRPALVEIGTRDGDPAERIVFVRDNGAGFDPRHAAKLFGVFQRLHCAREFEGTGIGLAIVRRIVGRHGGRVWAEGAPGAGATFYFSLPA